jgi:hypothetical protein
MNTSGREPLLPALFGSGGLEPALPRSAALVPAVEVLRGCHVFGFVRAEIEEELGSRTMAGFWKGTRRADLMAYFLPVGPPGSPARRKAARVACRFVRHSLRFILRDARPLRAVEATEAWANCDADPVPGGLFATDLKAADAAVAAAVREDDGLAESRDGAAARAAAFACWVRLDPEPWSAHDHLAGAAAFAAHAHLLDGPRDPGSAVARDRMLARFAKIIRTEYPDLGAVLAERQAAMSFGRK